MSKPNWTLAIVSILALAAVPALAKTSIHETKSASSDGIVSIDNLIGTTTVEGWEKNEIEITGELGEGPERLEFEVKGNRARIKVIWPEHGTGHHEHDEDTVLNIKVPRGSTVDATGVNTGITITGVQGKVASETVNGSIEITGGPESVKAETVNGSVHVDASTSEVKAETVNGEVNIDGAEGEVNASSVNGKIEIRGGPFRSADVSTISGSLRFEGDITGDDDFSFESHSGEVEIYLPETIQADFEVSTFSGSIKNDFGPEAKRKNKYAPGMELEFSTGSGGPTISVSSFSGTVHLKKK